MPLKLAAKVLLTSSSLNSLHSIIDIKTAVLSNQVDLDIPKPRQIKSFVWVRRVLVQIYKSNTPQYDSLLFQTASHLTSSPRKLSNILDMDRSQSQSILLCHFQKPFHPTPDQNQSYCHRSKSPLGHLNLV